MYDIIKEVSQIMSDGDLTFAIKLSFPRDCYASARTCVGVRFDRLARALSRSRTFARVCETGPEKRILMIFRVHEHFGGFLFARNRAQ